MANLINQERYYLKNEGLHALGLNPHLVIDPLTDVEQSYLDSESRKEVWNLVEKLSIQNRNRTL